MSCEVPAPGVDERLAQTTIGPVEAVSEHFRDAPSEADAALEDSECRTDLLEQAIQLQPKAKVALIRKLISHLETESIQAVLEFGLREIGDRHRRSTPSATVSHNTRLLLKKDYSYHTRGLSEPTQYYVYLRRRKPKLDRYIGTLFYIPQGCVLSYFLDAEGRIIFNPPHNVFQLRDSTNSAVVQIVRLICLEPPPPDYTFTKQQNDTPAIHLHLEYLDPKTYQPIAKQTYPFPVCMYEGGRLDRYRWEVSTVALPPEQSLSRPHLVQTSVAEPLPDTAALPSVSSTDCSPPDRGLSTPPNEVAQPTRRILELPATTGLTFYLSDRTSSDAILKRMRLWVAWSEKAMPRSRWEIVQDGAIYTLLNARFKRRILKFSSDRASVTLEHPLPVLMKWFHDLSLAVSQAPNQKPYSAAQLKLAHNLFVDTSLTQEDPLVALKQLFGVDFSKTSNDRA